MFCALLLVPLPLFAQTDQTSKPSLCTRENAVETIRQQVDLAKTFDNNVRRIAVLIRAADLLWPLQLDKARTIFGEAFDMAVQHEKEKSEQSKGVQTSRLLMEAPDQRFVVIRTVAKRDSALAKKLMAQIVKADLPTQTERPASDPTNDVLIAQRLLTSATQMLPVNSTTAMEFARTSLRYPASHVLARFLYVLASVNQRAADSFYEQALGVYGNRPMREFLYLATYPFAFRSSGDTPVFGFYNDVVPDNFKPNSSLQRRFVQTLLRRSHQALEVPLDQGDNFNDFPGLAHIAQVLLRIESEVNTSLPDMLPELIQTREKLLVSLPLETQRTLRSPDNNASPAPVPSKNFEEQIEQAEKLSNVDKRYQFIVTAILSVSKKEAPEVVLRAIDKIDDAQVRDVLKDWLHFNRALDAIKDKRMEEAETLTSKIGMLEPRAYLRTEIAKQLLNTTETQSHARELLEQAIAEVSKTPNTVAAIQTLFNASNLYLKTDLNRSISVLITAIEIINQIDALDFQTGDQTIVKEIRGRGFRRLVRFYVPGLDPESALRELAKVEFDVALSQATALTDKSQRAMATLSVVEICVEKASDQQRQKTKATRIGLLKP
jgi:hypothetical protein